MIKHVHLGFSIPDGAAVEIPIAHTFITGQTQLSGKTTALRAIVERSGRRALAFVTKRGENFDGRRVRPYLPREGDRQIHWRVVETAMATALGQRNLKWERGAIVTAAKGATSLAEVRKNVARLQEKAKKGQTEELYMLLGEYLDLVLPEMRALNAADELDLQPGLSVMDLGGVGAQTQAMVIRAALERINAHEHGVLTVFPEAWEFAPRSRAAPAKDEAIAMARKGAVLGNFLLCDSQDIAGVDTAVRQAASVWILGVQRELNELKRTLDTIPAGIARPRKEEIAQLELGQFFACWGKHAVKVYVQPAWMDEETARRVAMGAQSTPAAPTSVKRPKEETVNASEARELRQENDRLINENENLRRRLEVLEAKQAPAAAAAPRATSTKPAPASPAPRAFSAEESLGNEDLYQAIKARLIEELPSDPMVMKIILQRPELRVEVERQIITADGKSADGWIGRLIVDGFFENYTAGNAAFVELKRRGASLAKPTAYVWCDAMWKKGFLSKTEDGYRAVPGMKVNIVEVAA